MTQHELSRWPSLPRCAVVQLKSPLQGRDGLLLYCGLGLGTSLVEIALGLRWPLLLPGLPPPLANLGVWRLAQRRLRQPAAWPPKACQLDPSTPLEEIWGCNSLMNRSLAKAENQRASRSWLVVGAKICKRRRERDNDGRPVEVGVESIPSGLAAQMPLSGHYLPVGWSPGSQHWLEQLLAGAAASRRRHAEAIAALAGGRQTSDPRARRSPDADRRLTVGFRSCAGVEPAWSAAHGQLQSLPVSPRAGFHAHFAEDHGRPCRQWREP